MVREGLGWGDWEVRGRVGLAGTAREGWVGLAGWAKGGWVGFAGTAKGGWEAKEREERDCNRRSSISSRSVEVSNLPAAAESRQSRHLAAPTTRQQQL